MVPLSMMTTPVPTPRSTVPLLLLVAAVVALGHQADDAHHRRDDRLVGARLAGDAAACPRSTGASPASICSIVSGGLASTGRVRPPDRRAPGRRSAPAPRAARSWRTSAAQRPRPAAPARRRAAAGGGCQPGPALVGRAVRTAVQRDSFHRGHPGRAGPRRGTTQVARRPAAAFVNTVARRAMTCHRRATAPQASLPACGSTRIATSTPPSSTPIATPSSPRARAAGVAQIVIPAVDAGNFERVRELAHRHRPRLRARHPSDVHRPRRATTTWRRCATRSRATPTTRAWSRSARSASTTSSPASTATARRRSSPPSSTLAAEFDLPVLLHVRRAVDPVLAQLRRRRVRGGFAHAFNGSEQQAAAFVELGFRLGFGGALDLRAGAAHPPRRPRVPRRARSSWRPTHPTSRRSGATAPPRRAPPVRRCATSRPSSPRSAPSWQRCAARRRRRSPRRPRATRSTRCRGSRPLAGAGTRA